MKEYVFYSKLEIVFVKKSITEILRIMIILKFIY